MRLFAAVLPPEGPRAELAAAVDLLQECVAEGAMRAVQVPREGGGHAWALGEGGGREPADGLRWTEPAGWHFTLAFYGEVDEDVVPELSARLAAGGARAPRRSRWRVRGGGQFGHGRALWAGAAGDCRRCGCWPTGRRPRRARRACRWGSTAATTPTSPWPAAAGQVDLRPYLAALDASRQPHLDGGGAGARTQPSARSGVPGEQPRYEAVGRWPLGARPVRLGCVDPKTRNRIMAGALVLMFAVVVVAAAVARR